MLTTALYEQVTGDIIHELEKGAAPWVCTWDKVNDQFLPYNASTKSNYNGINIPILWMTARKRGFTSSGWMTFQQARNKSASVKKGEKGTHVVFAKTIDLDETPDNPAKRVSVLRAYVVFNTQQLTLPDERQPYLHTPEERQDDVSLFIKQTMAKIEHGFNVPAYIPSMDKIQMPTTEQFRGLEHYNATLLHELVHWTGHPSRLNREQTNPMSSPQYAYEELIAEMGAAFLCARLGVTGDLRHAGYIQEWLKLLRGDKKAVFKAASAASKADAYLTALFTKTTGLS